MARPRSNSVGAHRNGGSLSDSDSPYEQTIPLGGTRRSLVDSHPSLIHVPERPRKTPWVPDSHAPRCRGCKTPFNLFTRRHHCRRCGHIFCNFCSGERRRLPRRYGYGDVPQRVCRQCSNIDERVLRLVKDELTERLALVHRAYDGLQVPILQLVSNLLLPTLETANSSSGESNRAVSPIPQRGSGVMSPVPSDVKDILSEPVMQYMALLFARHCNRTLVKDRRVNLRLHKKVFVGEEAAALLSFAFPSFALSDAAAVGDLLRKGGLFDHATEPGHAFEAKGQNLYRLDECVVLRLESGKLTGHPVIPDSLVPATPVIVYWEVEVVRELCGKAWVSSMEQLCGTEGCVVEVRGHDVEVAFNKGQQHTFPVAALRLSPAASALDELPRLLGGTTADLSGTSIALSDVEPALIKAALLFTRHASAHLIRDQTYQLKVYTGVFVGSEAAEWLANEFQLSEANAVDLGEVLRRMGVYQGVAGASTFDSSFLLYRLTSGILSSLESAVDLMHKASSFNELYAPSPRSSQCNVWNPGDAVFISKGRSEAPVPHRYRGREGHVISGQGKVTAVQFPDGESWLFHNDCVHASPAADVLDLLEKGDYDLHNDNRLRSLTAIFVRHVSSHLVRDHWAGLRIHRNVFDGLEAVTWLTDSFPSLGASGAVAFCETLRQAGVIASATDEPVPFEKKSNFYRIRESSVAEFQDDRTLDLSGAAVGAALNQLLPSVLSRGSITKRATPQPTPRSNAAPSSSSVLDRRLRASIMESPAAKLHANSMVGPRRASWGGSFQAPPPPSYTPPIRPTSPPTEGYSADTNDTDALTALLSGNSEGAAVVVRSGFTPPGEDILTANISPTRRRPKTLPPGSAPALGRRRAVDPSVLKEGYVLKRSDTQPKWGIERLVVKLGGKVERHAPRARINMGGMMRGSKIKLRRVPVSSHADDIWVAPPAFAQQEEEVTITKCSVRGFVWVRTDSGEGFVKSSYLTPLDAIQSSFTISDDCIHSNDSNVPRRSDIEDLAGQWADPHAWQFGLVLENGNKPYFLCVETPQERDAWAAVLHEACE